MTIRSIFWFSSLLPFTVIPDRISHLSLISAHSKKRHKMDQIDYLFILRIIVSKVLIILHDFAESKVEWL